MSGPARRDFLKVTGVGAVAAGAAVVSSGGAADAQTVKMPSDAGRHEILAHIKDARTGRITVMVEGREVEIVDRALTAKLAHAVSLKKG